MSSGQGKHKQQQKYIFYKDCLGWPGKTVTKNCKIFIIFLLYHKLEKRSLRFVTTDVFFCVPRDTMLELCVGTVNHILGALPESYKIGSLIIKRLHKVRTIARYEYTKWGTSVWLECCIFTDVTWDIIQNMWALVRVLVTTRGAYPSPV